MIIVILSENRLQICGHARAAPKGKDIVCAAVSALTQSFINSMEQLTNDDIESTVAAGDVVIQYSSKLSEKGKLLRSSFILGIRDIAYTYPENVCIKWLGSQDQALMSEKATDG